MRYESDIEPCCRFCAHCRQIDETEAVCRKRGVVALDHKCFRYLYDPTKRLPAQPGYLHRGTFSAEDFSIDPE